VRTPPVRIARADPGFERLETLQVGVKNRAIRLFRSSNRAQGRGPSDQGPRLIYSESEGNLGEGGLAPGKSEPLLGRGMALGAKNGQHVRVRSEREIRERHGNGPPGRFTFMAET